MYFVNRYYLEYGSLPTVLNTVDAILRLGCLSVKQVQQLNNDWNVSTLCPEATLKETSIQGAGL